MKNLGRGETKWSEHTGQKRPENTDAVWEDCPGCDKCEHNDLLVLRKGSGRTTKSHEYIFHLTKSDEYYYDTDAIREVSESANPLSPSYRKNGKSDSRKKDRIDGKPAFGNSGFWKPTIGRNKRSVWKIATQPYKGAHFATFPEAIPEICIKAGTSEKGNCEVCGEPWARVVDKTFIKTSEARTNITGQDFMQGWEGVPRGINETETLGWKPTCKHDARIVPPIVLDPFGGSGTTAMVANKLGRHGISMDLSAKYVELARERTGIKAMDRWWKAATAGDIEELKKIHHIEDNDFDGLPMFDS